MKQLETIEDSQLDQVAGGLGAAPTPPNTGLGFGPAVGQLLSDLTGYHNPNQPKQPGLFGWGNLFGFL